MVDILLWIIVWYNTSDFLIFSLFKFQLDTYCCFNCIFLVLLPWNLRPYWTEHIIFDVLSKPWFCCDCDDYEENPDSTRYYVVANGIKYFIRHYIYSSRISLVQCTRIKFLVWKCQRAIYFHFKSMNSS